VGLPESDLTFVCDLVRRRSAIVIEADKHYLVECRLQPVARDLGFTALEEMIAELRKRPTEPLQRTVTEAMTTGETTFFRDTTPFDALVKNVLPGLFQARASERAIRFWSAACSTGQEPYTIAMVLRDAFADRKDWKFSILATDLNEASIKRARTGRYRSFEVNRGLALKHLEKHFALVDGVYEALPEVRDMIHFEPMNLVTPWQKLPTFDVIFLRNVLIYFDVPTRRAILGRAYDQLARDGVLFLGSAETTISLDDRFERVQLDGSVFYRRRG
jgi:chemotaxis protein methyltransferase CheR